MTNLRRVLLRMVATGALLAAVVVTVAPTGSGADEPSVVGWWYRDVPLTNDSVEAQSVGAPVVAHLTNGPASGAQSLPPAPLPTLPPEIAVPDPGVATPTPSQAPDGGLLVAADVTGVRAMSALRFDVADAGSAVLSLVIASGSTPSPGVRACPALSDWLPGPDQPWSARPAHDCDRLAVSSSVSADGTTMTWTLPDTFPRPGSTHYDVLLVPLSGDGTPFQIAFNKPDGSSFEVTSPPRVELPPAEEPLPEDLPPPIEYFSPDGFDFGFVGGGPDPDLPVEMVQVRPAAGGSSSNPVERISSALENPTTRRIATVLLVILAGLAYWQSNRTVQRAPRLLGALGGGGAVGALLGPAPSAPRGIGRFSRVRTERPPRF